MKLICSLWACVSSCIVAVLLGCGGSSLRAAIFVCSLDAATADRQCTDAYASAVKRSFTHGCAKHHMARLNFMIKMMHACQMHGDDAAFLSYFIVAL